MPLRTYAARLLPAVALLFVLTAIPVALSIVAPTANAQESNQGGDFLRQMQFEAVSSKKADWIHWGDQPGRFSNWQNHSNRLIPVYTFGMKLDCVSGESSPYRSEEKLRALYGELPEQCFNPDARYFDQTQIYDLQMAALDSGKKNIILLIFDGMDWQTTHAAATYRAQAVKYSQGRGNVLAFQTYGTSKSSKAGKSREVETDFGFCVTSCHNGGTKKDVNSQTVTNTGGNKRGGYSCEYGGETPWSRAASSTYLIGRMKQVRHAFTDSAASATSIATGRKTFNGAIGVDPDGQPLSTVAHHMQDSGFAVGVVTSVPLSHATPGSMYAHNVSRSDYQDISRDMLGLKSSFHRDEALPGMDVLIGCGFNSEKDDDFEKQGLNFIPGNKYVADEDLATVNVANGGKYVVAQRTTGQPGLQVLREATALAIEKKSRLLGIFGADCEHLPFQTADGNFDPTRGSKSADSYKPEEIFENPTLADMTQAALDVLAVRDRGMFLMVESGDVDWANHNNNIDDAIGAVFSGEAAFNAITQWVETNSNWDETVLIVTSDHGHMMTLDQPEKLIHQAATGSTHIGSTKPSAKVDQTPVDAGDVSAKQHAKTRRQAVKEAVE